MINLKKSKYNFFANKKNCIYGCNLISESIIEIEEKLYKKILTILNDPNNITFPEEIEMRNVLYREGFLIEDNIDELEYLKVRSRIARYGNTALGITVTPTLRCNFRCTYCYEEHENTDMDLITQNNLISFVEKEMKSKESLSIAWFGGEPLLKTDLLKNLSDKFMEICNTRGSNYNASIITNGYLLNDENIKLLKDIKVEKLQITLDGPPEIHNQKRYLVNGDNTFEVILENLKKAAGKFENIKLRVNIDKENMDYIEKLLDYLEPIKNDINIGFSPVSYPGACYNENNCLKGNTFSEFNTSILNKTYERGFKIIGGFVTTGLVYCGAYQINTYTVGPDGSLYNCVVDIGRKDRAIGNLVESGIDYKYPNMLPWAAYEPFDEKECNECEVLPACLGGCLKYLNKTDIENKNMRCSFKTEIVDRILLSSNIISRK